MIASGSLILLPRLLVRASVDVRDGGADACEAVVARVLRPNRESSLILLFFLTL